jgi:hypothetical protein
VTDNDTTSINISTALLRIPSFHTSYCNFEHDHVAETGARPNTIVSKVGSITVFYKACQHQATLEPWLTDLQSFDSLILVDSH